MHAALKTNKSLQRSTPASSHPALCHPPLSHPALPRPVPPYPRYSPGSLCNCNSIKTFSFSTKPKMKKQKMKGKINEQKNPSIASPMRMKDRAAFYLFLILQLLTCGLFNVLSVAGLYIHHCRNNNSSKRERERARQETKGAQEQGRPWVTSFPPVLANERRKERRNEERSPMLSAVRVAHVLHPPASIQGAFSHSVHPPLFSRVS